MLRIWLFTFTIAIASQACDVFGQGNVNSQSPATALLNSHTPGNGEFPSVNGPVVWQPRISLSQVTLETPQLATSPKSRAQLGELPTVNGALSWQTELPPLSLVTLGQPASLAQAILMAPQSMATLELAPSQLELSAFGTTPNDDPLPPTSDDSLSLAEVDQAKSEQPSQVLNWQDQVLVPQIAADRALLISLSALIPAALQQSKKIEIARLQSFFELERVTQSDANFDWNVFTKKMWTDTDEPTGSELEAGPGSRRRLAEDLSLDAGLRRTNRVGGQFEASQNLRFFHTNSQFTVPNDQGISRMVLRYNQPLLRNGGRLVNEGQVLLAQTQAEASNAEYQTQINDVLERVVKAYWELYRSRANYCIQRALVANTQDLLVELLRRRRIDAQPALVAQVESQLSGQLATLRAVYVSVQRAQYELVREVGDRSLDTPLELVPQEFPLAQAIAMDVSSAFAIALQNRGELRAAVKRIQGTLLSKDIAKHQLLPQLAMIMETSVAGINGNFAAFKSLGDQFSERAPTYSIGFSYDYPIGNRAAQSRFRQAQVAAAREMVSFEDAVDQIRKEVRDAVAGLEGYVGIAEKRRDAVVQANVEVNALLERRRKYPEEFDQVSQLYIRTYLDALQRRAQAEQALVSAHVEYSISLVQLRRALGILVSVGAN